MTLLPPTHPFTSLDLPTLLDQRARLHPDHAFLVWCPFEGEPRRWTYAQFAEQSAQLAGGLAARGVRKGDRVLVQLENSPEVLLTLFACARLGAVHVAVNPAAAGPELKWFAELTGALAAITEAKFEAGFAAHCPSLRWVAVTGTPSFDSLFASPVSPRAPEPSLPALIMFTSGTTSRPKAVLWTHANTLWGGRVGALHQALRRDDVYQIFLPLCHVVALSWSFFPALWAGATVVLQPRFSASRYWPAALEHGSTVGSQVIFSARVLAQQPPPAGHRFRQWIDALCRHEIEAHFGVRTLGAWGMTEMVAQGIVGDPWLPQRNGSIGRPSPAYDIRLVDDEGRPIEPGQTGNLLVGGRPGLSIFAEYFNDPEATAAAFDAQGLFRTGDRVTLHEDGFIEFSERARDLIKVGGEGVAPAEIERVVLEVPDIRECAVVAKPDADYGEVAVAFVVTGQKADTALEAKVIEHCRASLAKFKVPRQVIVIDELPRISIGKIAKAQLRERLKQPIQQAGGKG